MSNQVAGLGPVLMPSKSKCDAGKKGLCERDWDIA